MYFALYSSCVTLFINFVFVARPLISAIQHRVVNRNIQKGYPGSPKGTGNCANSKVREPVEPDYFFPRVKYQK